MSHFAQVKNGIVAQVIVAEQDFIDAGYAGDPQEWIQTSIRTAGNTHPEGRPLRGNFAGIGHIYDAVNDVFYAPQTFPSWTLNTETWLWEPPTPYPQDGLLYDWDESTISWISRSQQQDPI